MILIDNYDSFTYNVVQYLKGFGIEPKVFKNDEITIKELKKMDFSSLIISPGPGTPNKAGISYSVIKEFYKTKKILGICLGHQCIAQFFGCKIIKDKDPFHGKVSKIYFRANEGVKMDGFFEGIEDGFEATRYHSLIVDENSLSDCIVPLAHTKNGILMALKHKEYPVYGVQFHPEAILTEYGKKLLSNFISIK